MPIAEDARLLVTAAAEGKPLAEAFVSSHWPQVDLREEAAPPGTHVIAVDEDRLEAYIAWRH